jgi:hypothetical protein
MRAPSFVAALLLLATTAACGGSSAPPARANPAAPAKAPTAAAPAGAGALPIAQYLGSDDATGLRVRELLHASGIESSAGGSLGYSVWVDGPNRAKAREILIAAATTECLPITVFDDQAQLIAGTRPARCDPPAPPAPVDHKK